METKLYFQALRESGYSLQLVVNLELKMVSVGYCLFAWQTPITLKSKKDLHRLAAEFVACGFTKENNA